MTGRLARRRGRSPAGTDERVRVERSCSDASPGSGNRPNALELTTECRVRRRRVGWLRFDVAHDLSRLFEVPVMALVALVDHAWDGCVGECRSRQPVTVVPQATVGIEPVERQLLPRMGGEQVERRRWRTGMRPLR